MRLALAIVLAAAAAAQTEHQHHPPRDAGEYARVLEDPARDTWQLPHQVIMALDIQPGEVIADIGAGAGYFTRRLARHAAKVYAVDIDSALLQRLERDVAKQGDAGKVQVVLASPDDPKLPPRSVDTVFFCDVLHHIQNRAAYFEKLAKVLKPGGRIVNIDFETKPTPVGPPASMRLSRERVEEEFHAAGFRKSKQFDLLPYQYFLIFTK